MEEVMKCQINEMPHVPWHYFMHECMREYMNDNINEATNGINDRLKG